MEGDEALPVPGFATFRVCFNFVVREWNFLMEQETYVRYRLVPLSNTHMQQETTFLELQSLLAKLFQLDDSEFPLFVSGIRRGSEKVMLPAQIICVHLGLGGRCGWHSGRCGGHT
jgi:hypothetical protein